MDNKYSQYLFSGPWFQLVEQVKLRSGGICEGCRRELSDHVHHITYERLFNEDLDDLIDLCAPCHEKEHGIFVDDKFTLPEEKLAAERRSFIEEFTASL